MKQQGMIQGLCLVLAGGIAGWVIAVPCYRSGEPSAG